MAKKKKVKGDYDFMSMAKTLQEGLRAGVPRPIPMPEDPNKMKKIMMVIDKKGITVQQYTAFEMYCRSAKLLETADALGLTANTILRWKRQDWWGSLQHEMLESYQGKFHLDMSEHVQLMADCAKNILDGTLKEPKLATAAVKIMDLFTKLGKRYGQKIVDPLQPNKADITIDNSVHEEKTLNINISEMAHKMTREELSAYSLTGKPPERLLEIAVDEEDLNEFDDVLG